ncbi:MAG: diguanylate cyclase domain-containing protein [Eubacterium sp.]
MSYGQKEKILIADDSKMNRSVLSTMLNDKYEIIEAENGINAVAILQKQLFNISLVLLDTDMPKLNGFEVLEVMNKNHWIDDIPVIMIFSEKDFSIIKDSYALGITDFIIQPFDDFVVRNRIENTIFLYTKHKKLINMVDAQIYENEKNNNIMINILSCIAEIRNQESIFHIINIRTLTEALLKQLKKKSLGVHITYNDISLISNASALYDIGKITLDDKILKKPGKLTEEEFSAVKTHSIQGAYIIKQIPAYQDEPLVKTAYEICRWHHERYDGKGYPDGLYGDEIPLSAQIVSLADVYIALTNERTYRKAYTHQTAMNMINDGECGTFNPLLLECLNDISENIYNLLSNEIVQAKPCESKSLIKEMVHQNNLIPSDSLLHLMDYKKKKYNFFSAINEEIIFEYTTSPSMLILSKQGAEKLRIDETVVNPESSEKIEQVLGFDIWNEIKEKLCSSSKENAVVKYDCRLRFNNEERWHRIIAMAIWSNDEIPSVLGVIGKAIDIHDAKIKIENLKNGASHDSLTNLLNHTYAKERINKLLKKHPENDYVLIICDLDRFKFANDNYGHLFGDSVLKNFAENLRRSVNSDDIICRVGGDEFLIFMQNKNNTEAIINCIFTSLMEYTKKFSISVSMGIATTNTVSFDYDSLFIAADNALYYAKQNGRSRFCFYDDSMKDMLSIYFPIGCNDNIGGDDEINVSDNEE